MMQTHTRDGAANRQL